MACEGIIGVKNILLTFTHCDSGQTVKNLSHALSSDEIPQVRTVPFKSEAIPGGYTRRHSSYCRINMKVIVNRGLHLSWYQGAASVDVQIEYEDGRVLTGTGGTVSGEETSDMHEANMQLTFRGGVTELLPDGALATAA